MTMAYYFKENGDGDHQRAHEEIMKYLRIYDRAASGSGKVDLHVAWGLEELTTWRQALYGEYVREGVHADEYQTSARNLIDKHRAVEKPLRDKLQKLAHDINTGAAVD